MKKILTLFLAFVMAAVLFAGCNTATTSGSEDESAAATTDDSVSDSAPAGDGEVNIGVVLPTRDEPRWLQDQARFEEIIADTGYTVEVLFSQGDSAVERTNVETLIAKGIDVLIICAQDAAAAAATAQLAKDEGVTVISYDRLITDTDAIDYYVTFDSVAVGEAQGQYLVDNANGTGLPLYLYAGAATDNNAFLFFEGAWKVLQPKIADGTFVIVNSSEAVALQDQPNLTTDDNRDELSRIIGQITTNWDFNVARSLAEAHLTSVTADSKGECYILAPNDGTARSIADVFADDVDVTSYYITGQDCEVASVQYIIDGKQSMTVFKDTRVLAADAMNLAVEVMGGGSPATSVTYNNGVIDVPSLQSPIEVITKENVQSVLIDSGYYDASEFSGL